MSVSQSQSVLKLLLHRRCKIPQRERYVLIQRSMIKDVVRGGVSVR